jgi:hypothetical protein
MIGINFGIEQKGRERIWISKGINGKEFHCFCNDSLLSVKKRTDSQKKYEGIGFTIKFS